MQPKKSNTKQLTVCAMLAAIGVVLLYLGSVIEVVDISMAVIASLACVIAVIEYGKGAPWLVFGVTAVLSVVLLPNKSPAVMYALFFGYYPILKEKFENMSRSLGWFLKELVFNIALVAILFAMKLLLFLPDNIPLMLYIIAVALCEVIFILYDFALTRLISLYVYKLRRRFKFK